MAGYVMNSSGAAAVDECVTRLREGRTLVLFPEGTRSPSGGLLPFQSIYENIVVSRRQLGLACPGPADDILRFLGVHHLARRIPAKVSIGERQRAAVARAIAHSPRIVLADEPTASLDPVNAEKVMALFVRLAAELGITLVVVSHDRALVERMDLRPIVCAVADGTTIIRDEPGAAAA